MRLLEPAARGAIRQWAPLLAPPDRVPAARPAPRQLHQSHCGLAAGAKPGALCLRPGGAKAGIQQMSRTHPQRPKLRVGARRARGRQRWRSSGGHDLGGVTAKTKGGSNAAAACWCLRSQRRPSHWPTQRTDPSSTMTSHFSWFRVPVPDFVNDLLGWGFLKIMSADAGVLERHSIWKTGTRGLGDVQGPQKIMFFGR